MPAPHQCSCAYCTAFVFAVGLTRVADGWEYVFEFDGSGKQRRARCAAVLYVPTTWERAPSVDRISDLDGCAKKIVYIAMPICFAQRDAVVVAGRNNAFVPRSLTPHGVRLRRVPWSVSFDPSENPRRFYGGCSQFDRNDPGHDLFCCTRPVTYGER